MKTTKTNFVRKPLAAAVMCSALGLSPAVFGATIDSVNEDNLAVPPVDGKTLVYTDTEGTATFGWLDPVNDSGVIGRGIEVYNEAFTGKVDEVAYDFAGCIMAQPDRQLLDPPQVNCQAPGDSGKRFKLKTTETNGPIDLVFNVTSDSEPKLYRVIGKFSNLTDITNSVGGALKGFRFETGFGVGNEFTPSSAEDGLSFGFRTDIDGKLSIGPVGKYPGGLFGGSKVEGLPFFNTSIAEFVESDVTLLDQDTLETNGIIPTPYSDLAGADSGWLALTSVPTGWFIDHDGNPSNDSILLAYDDPKTPEEDWKTFEKVFRVAADDPTGGWDGTVVYEFDHDDDRTTAPIPVDIPAVNWDPNGDSFNADVTWTVTNEDGSESTYTVQNYVNDVSPLVNTLDEGDPVDGSFDAVALAPNTAEGLYTGFFNVLIDGEAVLIDPFADWANTPVTIRDSAVDAEMLTDASKFVVWNPEALDGEGAYEANPAYTGAYVFSDYDLDGDSVLSLTEISSAGFFAQGSTDTLARWPGYVQGAIEDLANVNINTTISVAETFSMNWPTCTGDGTQTNCTFTLRVTGLNDAVEAPSIPVTPVEPEPEEPAASSSDGDGTIFGCTAGKPGSPFDPVLPSMVLMALAGLWARKRRATA
ncbi:hypothetical protein DET50_10689 [Marinobacter pelagius]|uniref:Uncharacterized protein n=1 Tax=Marinobacter pelagius TaxID=379482 RepID=A0A366GT85_9GAMM|nr:choice-of-anchor F family protein [Marinobacter pelagius]RBP31068.1 hypothetical protein DET50_10689 [Marinobacter pelagius]